MAVFYTINNMKITKPLLIIQLALMYLSEILITIGALVVVEAENETLQIVMKWFFFSGIILAGVVAFLSTFILIPIIMSIFKKNNQDMTKFTMIIKLAAIPWYILNFIMCFFTIAGMFNPFMMIGIPFMIVIFVCITYIDMVVVSANNVAVIISELKTKQIKFSPLLIIGIIFHFIFCLDVLGAIFTYVNYKKIIARQ